MNIFKEFGLREVINANGKMTVLGASAVSPEVAESVKNALQNFAVIDELIDYTGRLIAKKTGAEDGCPTCGAAAGIAISAAAVIAGENLSLIEQMPDSDGLKNEIIIQKGQSVNFGGSIAQMIRLGGGRVKEVGCANKVEEGHIEGGITDKTAALLYVKSHHAVQKGMQSIAVMQKIADRHGIPLIIDAAAEEDMEKYIRLGAQLVIYSGGKALAGPTSGFICGRKDLIRACKKQYKGIGRAMKVSKEAMAGLITALNGYSPEDKNAAEQKESMNRLCVILNGLKGLSCRVVQDEAGREIYRAEIRIDSETAGISAEELNAKLKAGSPAIFLRDYYMNQGILSIDPRPLFADQEEVIVEQIKRYIKGND